MSMMESFIVIFVKSFNHVPSAKEKEEILLFLQGYELPTVIGTFLLEFQMLWTHVDDQEN